MATSEPVLTIRRTFVRAEQDHLAVLHGVPTGFVVDAQMRKGALDHRVKPITAMSSFVGSALTVLCRPWDNLAAHAVLEFIQPGDVLVIATGGFEGAAVIGEKYVGMARNCGAVAIVVDGMARDVAGIERIGIPVFTRGVTPNSAFKNGPGEVGLPISVGGIPVESGDAVVGDADGVVVVSQRFLTEVASRVQEIKVREAEMFEQIAGGGSKPAAMASIIADSAVRYVE